MNQFCPFCKHLISFWELTTLYEQHTVDPSLEEPAVIQCPKCEQDLIAEIVTLKSVHIKKPSKEVKKMNACEFLIVV